MATATAQSDTRWTAADLVEHVGPILLTRIRHDPPAGTATEGDVVEIHAREGRLFELVDGVLVEKTMGYQEAYLALLIGRLIGDFVDQHDLGLVAGADGMARLAPGLVRIPDVSFVGWDRLPGRKVPTTPMLNLAPHLAVEILSPHNTGQEMPRKLAEYFGNGVIAVWYVDPSTRTVTVYSSPVESVILAEDQSLDGGSLLPRLSIKLADVFAKLEPRA
jgi:Uma2 family endonuclease